MRAASWRSGNRARHRCRTARDSLRADSATSMRRETADRRNAAACASHPRRGYRKFRSWPRGGFRTAYNRRRSPICGGRSEDCRRTFVERLLTSNEIAKFRAGSAVGVRVIDAEIVELARRAIALEIRGLHIGDACPSPEAASATRHARAASPFRCSPHRGFSPSRARTAAPRRSNRRATSPASPQTTRFPACAMKADIWPILPLTTISMPFIEMPHRDEALPSITSRPPLPVAPAYWLASPFTMTSPDIMFSATPGSGRTVHRDPGLPVHAGAVIADVALHGDLGRSVHADRDRVRPPGIEDFPVRLVGAGRSAREAPH